LGGCASASVLGGFEIDVLYGQLLKLQQSCVKS